MQNNVRDGDGLELHRQLSGGVGLDWQHDAAGRPTSQRLSAGRQVARQRRYRWQGADQLTELEDSVAGTTRYTYDALGALAGATYADGQHELRQPDAVGNLFRTAERTDRRYGKGGQLQQARGTRYKYDAEGNLIRKTLTDGQQWHYGWDGAGQLASVKRPDGYAVTFGYDAFGRRISKRFRGKVTRWVWDGNQPLHEWTELELDGHNTQDVITWLFEPDSFAPLAKLQGASRQSIVCDHLGTPLEMHDQRGGLSWAAELDSYGAVRQSKGEAGACPFRYQGQYADVETGLYYNRFRYYDPQAGQYVSQDPIRLWGGEQNLYIYVHNPNTWVDILGLNGFLFRGDDGYVKGSSIGTPLGAAADIETPWEHVRRASNGETSKFTSFAETRGNASKFTKKGNISKVSLDDLSTLEQQGKIKIYTPDSVKNSMLNSGSKKIAKDANNVAEIMRKNKEILIEGEIPGQHVKCG